MAVVGDSGLPHDAGRRDALHHRERLRRKITEQLKERIGEEDIVAAGPDKRIRVPVDHLRVSILFAGQPSEGREHLDFFSHVHGGSLSSRSIKSVNWF